LNCSLSERPPSRGGVVGSFRRRLDGACASRGLGGGELGLPDADDGQRCGNLEPRKDVARELLPPVVALAPVELHAVDVGRVARRQLGGQPRREILAKGARGDGDDVESAALGDGGDGRGEALDRVVGERRIVDGDDLLRAEGGEVLGRSRGAGADGEHGERRTHLLGEVDRAVRGLADLTPEELRDDECCRHVRSPSLPS
jgi:hypothetical protein